MLGPDIQAGRQGMRAIGTVAAAAASIALAGCQQLGGGVSADGDSTANAATAPAAAGKPAGGGGNVQTAADPGPGLGGKDQGGAIRASAGTAGGGGIDRAFMLGRWTDDEDDCDRAADFFADGRFVPPDGREGVWSLAGDRLTMTREGETFTVQLVPIDRNSMTVVNADGSLGRSTRC